MEYEIAVKELAPCGLDCSRCMAFKDGDIVRHSNGLKESLTNFEKMAKRLESMVPEFKDYERFVGVLDRLTQGSCEGCRNGHGMPSCAAKDCHIEEKVDFCFQCGKYPCTKNDYNDELYQKWQTNNDNMKRDGVETFYSQQKKKPRY